MSRNNQAEILENPSKRKFKWSTIKEEKDIEGQKIKLIKGGAFSYYDKEKKEDVVMPKPFRFAILNMDLMSLSGYDEKKKRSVWSNEVRDKGHVVKLFTKGGTLMEFKKEDYKANSAEVKSFGAKFTVPVYVAMETGENGEWETHRLLLSGSPLTGATDYVNKKEDEKNDGWFNFTANNRGKLYSNFIVVNNYKTKVKGETTFTIPVYEIGESIDKPTLQILQDLDKDLSKYLDWSFKSASTNVTEAVPAGEEPDDTLPFDPDGE